MALVWYLEETLEELSILPGKDFVFDESDPKDTGADLSLENVALEKQKAYGEKKAKEKAAVKKLKANVANSEE